MVPIVDRLIYLPVWLFGTESSWIGQCKCFIYIILLDISINKTSLKPKHWVEEGGPIFFNMLEIVMAEDLYGTASPKVLSP